MSLSRPCPEIVPFAPFALTGPMSVMRLCPVEERPTLSLHAALPE